MKEQLKKADLFGLAIIAATLIAYSIRSVWTMYQTIAAVVGGLLVVISIALKLPDIRAGLGRRSTKFGINSATSVVLVLGILAFVNYLGAQHSKVVDMTTEKIYSLSDQSVQVAPQVKEDLHIKAFYPGLANTRRLGTCCGCSRIKTAKYRLSSSIRTSSRRSRSSTR